MTLLFEPFGPLYDIEADRIEGTISRGVLTLRIPRSKPQTQEGVKRVDIRDQQRAPKAVSPAA